ncbi:creatininase family protein [Lichenifustis flavocetrariae]|uniref:Creatininase family protein n=1 Tax=Lichenifustis flavocetrariae TaxID=2949735 RepID=A0AA41YYG1_9HYPH|nr:creatininase family protein [Lichenifustis flavocetrariae]MCW6509596.1 creatininase family protein [Lichenifustis flavocetrariae]
MSEACRRAIDLIGLGPTPRGRRLPAIALLLVSALVAPARAQAPDSVWLEDLTWTELRDQIRAGTTTVIIPVGGVEQSGPALALGKHDARARVLAEAIARRLGHTLVAPVVAYVPEGGVEPPTSHMRFPGTITVPDDAFRKTIESAAASFKLHGFKDVVLIGEHGSYQSDLGAVAEALNRRWAATPARAHFIPDYYRGATTDFSLILKQHGYSAAEIGTHAGVADTSLTMAVAPSMVRTGALKAAADLDAVNGVYGDPRRSNAAMGQLAIEAIVTRTVAAIKVAITRTSHP